MLILDKILDSTTGNTEDLYSAIRDRKNIAVFGMQWADRTITASRIDKFVFVAADYVSAQNAFRQISCLREDAVYLPAKDDALTFIHSRSNDAFFARLDALYRIASGATGAVVASVEAIMQLFPDRNDFLSRCMLYRSGEEYDLETVTKKLADAGYRRETQVTGKGQFALRGDILDIAPVNFDCGIRVEFFGDCIESIKEMDFATQTSGPSRKEADISPCGEFFDTAGVLERMRDDIPPNLDGEAMRRMNNILSEIEFKLIESRIDAALSYCLPYAGGGDFWSFCGSDFVAVSDDIKKLNIKMVYGEHCARYKQLLPRGELLLRSSAQLCDTPFLRANRLVGFYSNPQSSDIFVADESFSFSSVPVPNYSKNFPLLLDDIRLWSDKGMRIFLFCGSESVRDNIAQNLLGGGISYSFGYDGNICLLTQELYKGAVLFDCGSVLIGTGDLIIRRTKKAFKRSRKDIFSQPRMGEYVVHNVHGVGVCESVEKLTSAGVTRDYLAIRYKDGDKLFVPVENMDSLTKYNSGEETPQLSRIGGADFARAKERVRQSVKKMAFGLLKLYAERGMEKGEVYNPYHGEMSEFCNEFPYVETDDQLQAAEEGLRDLACGKIMDRLLCGDVGYGKTEVAVRLAYNVILNGKQVAFVSPTTILARQHYLTVKDRMEKFGVRAVSLTRLDSAADTKKALAELREGKADIVCGTHRALGKDVAFSDLGLLILDEEQRFGVADKEKIKLIKKNVNVLSLSATPIPRTLHMSMAGIRDISVLDTPPSERIPVQTYVTEYTDSLIIDAAGRELGRGGQVFIVYNRVASIDTFAARVSSLIGIEVGIIHGQMPEKQMENMLTRFINKEIDVLVASTIIENGIDMPDANTMIVIDADRLGLSQLYQLRGRIGRSNRLAYVFFTYDDSKILTESAQKRLESINEFTEFGSGFKIAMRDLQIRGAGNILGREQHGHMDKVGYDMYLKILGEETERLKGADIKERSEVKVNIDFDAHIPEKYIPDAEWRLKIYSRISHIEHPDEIVRLDAELRDIYGAVPASVTGLCRVALVKNLCADASAESVTLKKSECTIGYARVIDIPAKVINAVNAAEGCSLSVRTKPVISFGKGEKAAENMFNFLLNI